MGIATTRAARPVWQQPVVQFVVVGLAVARELALTGRELATRLSYFLLATTPDDALLAAARHAAVHDFGGFDPALFHMRYDAPGAPALAAEVAQRLGETGVPARLLDHGGLDHGIWVPLRAVFPQADVPVLPLAFSPQAATEPSLRRAMVCQRPPAIST